MGVDIKKKKEKKKNRGWRKKTAQLHFGNPKREYKLKVLNLTNLIIKA